MERPENSAAEFWPILNNKGPNVNTIVSLLLSSLILGEVSKNIVIFPLTQTKEMLFLSQIPSKRENYWGTEFFSLADEFFFWIGRKVLQRVGNTVIRLLRQRVPIVDKRTRNLWIVAGRRANTFTMSHP